MVFFSSNQWTIRCEWLTICQRRKTIQCVKLWNNPSDNTKKDCLPWKLRVNKISEGKKRQRRWHSSHSNNNSNNGRQSHVPKSNEQKKRTIWENVVASILEIIFKTGTVYTYTDTSVWCICIVFVFNCGSQSSRSIGAKWTPFFQTLIWHIQYGWMPQCN